MQASNCQTELLASIHAFPFVATLIWNELPHSVVSASSVSSYRHRLKTSVPAIFLFVCEHLNGLCSLLFWHATPGVYCARRRQQSPERTILRHIGNIIQYNTEKFLEFLDTWKCQGIWLGSVKDQGKGQKSGKGQEICVVGGNLIVAALQNAGSQTVVWKKYGRNFFLDSFSSHSQIIV